MGRMHAIYRIQSPEAEFAARAEALAALAYRMACAGIDVIKDDHGLADPSSAPFGNGCR